MRAFVTIGRLQSFTRAAEALHTTQPALSARIRELEGALAVRLFDRNTRSVRLTQAGEDLLPIVEQVLNDLGSLIERASDVASRNTGRVAVAALPSIASELLPRTVARFRGQHPGITVTLRDAVADRVLDLVRNRDVDVGVTSFGGGDPVFDFTTFASDRIVAVLPREHPLARRRKLSLPSLVEHPLILMDRDSSVRHLVDATYAALGRISAPMFEATFMSTAIGLVRAGLGITLLPSSAHEVRSATDLAVRSVAHAGLERTIGVLRLRGRSLSPAAKAFVTTLAVEARARSSRPRAHSSPR
ncbi:MAG TPA: LysR family transcriptional regulator [Casimicrobiaceae bacterium]|nr:LysR family transcriptional regulator [Casimicrobiaceae bacterium]